MGVYRSSIKLFGPSGPSWWDGIGIPSILHIVQRMPLSVLLSLLALHLPLIVTTQVITHITPKITTATASMPELWMPTPVLVTLVTSFRVLYALIPPFYERPGRPAFRDPCG